MHTLLWFQHDLRLTSNPALDWALQRGSPLSAVYVHSPAEEAPWEPGPASRWWLHHSLQRLSADLRQHGIKLAFFRANSVEIIPQLATACSADAVVWTNRHEPRRIEHENVIERQLHGQGITVQRFQDGLLTGPGQFLTATSNTPYKVFTPFYRRLRRELSLAETSQHDESPAWTSISPVPLQTGSASLEELGLLDEHCWHEKLHRHWSPGEADALRRLDRFVSDALSNYGEQRDIPASDGTSSLSPHLHFGEISPRQIVNTLAPLIEFHGGNMATAAEGFLRQLLWREFARYILWHFPETSSEPMNRKFTPSFWKNDKAGLHRWQRGTTGIPIVDAGMRQLWETGWMHNRVRMLVASLLTKNMGIPWQQGARWFWETLVDADLANNSMGWQWVAGCGVDAAPYFRIFNPHTQARRFDPGQTYTKHWLQNQPAQPPVEPVVDLAASRSKALDRYNRLVRGQRK
jgi:deoxyribodipyrimidine photo-lyase